MRYCPKCGRLLESNAVYCRCGAPAGRAKAADEEPPAPQQWIDFRAPDGSFSLQYPADWTSCSTPISEGATLCCVGPKGYQLLEAFSYERSPEVDIEPGMPDMVSISIEGLQETLGLEAGRSNAQIVSCTDFDFPGMPHAARLVATYVDRGMATKSEYVLVGDDRRSVMLAFKVLTSEYAKLQPLFEHVTKSLRPGWSPTSSPKPHPSSSSSDTRTTGGGTTRGTTGGGKPPAERLSKEERKRLKKTYQEEHERPARPTSPTYSFPSELFGPPVKPRSGCLVAILGLLGLPFMLALYVLASILGDAAAARALPHPSDFDLSRREASAAIAAGRDSNSSPVTREISERISKRIADDVP